jgi:malate/lactate dehydrogenase
MILAVVGCGNVGSNLLHYIVEFSGLDCIFVWDTSQKARNEAILDLVSHFPRHSRICFCQDLSAVSEADILVVTAGYKLLTGEQRNVELRENRRIVNEIFYKAKVKPTCIVLTIPGPVELIAADIQKLTRLAPHQVIGFGGDLDHNRLLYSLAQLRIRMGDVHVIGEHGRGIIPVLQEEEHYNEIARLIRTYLQRIASLSGAKRNIASAPMLSELIKSILHDSGKIHYVAGMHPFYGQYLTWPFLITREGIQNCVNLSLLPKACEDLKSLVFPK